MEKPRKKINKEKQYSLKTKALLLVGVAALGLSACFPTVPTLNPSDQRYATQVASLPIDFLTLQTLPGLIVKAQVKWGQSPITSEPEVDKIVDPTITHPCKADPIPTDIIGAVDLRQQLCEQLETAGKLYFIPEEQLSEFVSTTAAHTSITDPSTAKILCKAEADGCYLAKADQIILSSISLDQLGIIAHEPIHRALQQLAGKQYLPNEDACIKSNDGRISIIMKLKNYPNYPFVVDPNDSRYAVLIIYPETLPTLFEELARLQVGGDISPYLTNASPEVMEFYRLINQKMIDNPSARLPTTLLPEASFERFIAALEVLFDGEGAIGLVESDQNFRKTYHTWVNPEPIPNNARTACQ